MNTQSLSPKKLITIGGWDACGTFGVPADIKTFTSLGCHGMGVLTVATLLNSKGWVGAEPLSADFVGQQLEVILSDYGADALKTGFLGRVDIVEVVAQKIKAYGIKNIVVDPVLLDGKAKPMFDMALNDAYERLLFPLATVITPNLRELNYLIMGETTAWADTTEARQELSTYYRDITRAESKSLLALKGLPSADEGFLQDGWFDGETFQLQTKPLIKTHNVSGSGDTFSAAITAFLALGFAPKRAIEQASYFTHQAIARAAGWQLAQGAGPVAHIDPQDFRV